MVFAHDWSVFYLIKNLRVTEFSILWTLGFTVSRKKEELQHLFNRLYKALYSKFGDEIKIELDMEVQSLWWYSYQQYLRVSLHNYLQIRLKSSHWFDVDPECDNWIREFQGRRFIDATYDQIRYNLAKAVHVMLSS
jgi:hypothetical protein